MRTLGPPPSETMRRWTSNDSSQQSPLDLGSVGLRSSDGDIIVPVTEPTESVVSEVPRVAKDVDWALVLSLDCQQIFSTPLRLALGGVTEVDIGRGGAERCVERADGRLRIDLPDRWASQRHARLVRTGDGWAVEDLGSKNGTLVNGRAVDRAELSDGDVIECGGTFFVLRRGAAPISDLEGASGPTEGLRTMSSSLERDLAVLPKIARARIPVLVRGASGTGKEVIANAIHAMSGRNGPLVSVNCGAIPTNLVESELFGSRRGAFSGAEERPGLVRNSDRGTLFLDEVAELPIASQAALLRVLQGGEVVPLGAGGGIMVDVRIIAATNQAIEDFIREGRFRHDLYARLRGYEINMPHLRARLEDMGLLIASLLARLEPNARPRRLSRAAARALFAHPWPFHIRELEQVLGAAVAVANGPEIGLADLPVAVREPNRDVPGVRNPAANDRQRLVALLEKHAGNLSAVARALATSRSQVRRLMLRYSLDDKPFRQR